MLKRLNILIIIFYLFFFNLVSSDDKILFIDLDYIFLNSLAGKKINDEILNKSKNIQNEFNNYKQKISDEKNQLINQKNVLNKDEYKKKFDKLEKKVVEFNKSISKKNNDLIKFKDNAKIEFSNKLREILEEYSTKKSVEMIIYKKNILIGKNNLDATKDVLDLLDKKVKKIKIQ